MASTAYRQAKAKRKKEKKAVKSASRTKVKHDK